MKNKSPKITYAQSSDIKSRTFSEYRDDMKKKGIRELEFKDYLRDRLVDRFDDSNITVEKFGADAKLWFQRAGGRISQEPDYEAKRSKTTSPMRMQRGTKDDLMDFYKLYEFQLANAKGLNYFDFKVSKVGKKKNRVRIPHMDREFFYVVADENKFAFITPKWIFENGVEDTIPAWRSQGIRVERNVFLTQFKDGGSTLATVLKSVDEKIYLLDYQQRFLDSESEKLSKNLQRVVDHNVEFKIVPKTLKGIHEVCFLMEKMGKQPDAPNVWLVYLATFFVNELSSIDFARFIFAFDFIYFKCNEILENERQTIKQMVMNVTDYIERRAVGNKGQFKIDPNESLLDGLSHLVFAVNRLEDIKQDAAITFGIDVPIVKKIFETIPNVAETVNQIKSANVHNS